MSVIVDPEDENLALVNGKLARKGRVIIMPTPENLAAPTVAEINAAGPGFETYIVDLPFTEITFYYDEKDNGG